MDPVSNTRLATSRRHSGVKRRRVPITGTSLAAGTHTRLTKCQQHKPNHSDRSRDHAQARNETTTSNTDFPAPASRKVTINQHVLSILHVGSHHLQHRLSHATKPKNYHKTNTFCPLTPNRHITNTLCPLTPNRHITNTFCPLTQLILEMRTAGGAACLLSAREVSLERQGNNERPRRQSRALFLRPMGVGCVRQIARATLSDFRHLVHTFRRLGVPLTRARTR